MGFVSDEAVEAVMSELVINRVTRREIQKFTRDQLQRYVVHIYRLGFEDGADALKKAMEQEAAAKCTNPDEEFEEVSVLWDDVMRLIGEVKGVGPELLGRIDTKLREVY